MRIIFSYLWSFALLLVVQGATAQALPPAQTVPAPSQTPAGEPPVKAVPLTDRKAKPQRVGDDGPLDFDGGAAHDHGRNPAHGARRPHGPHIRPRHGLGGHRNRL